jgi:hypothetical protein
MNDRLTYCTVATDPQKKTLVLTERSRGGAKLTFTFARPSPNELILDGPIDSRPTHVQLRLQDRSKFPLVSRGFHWVQEYPFNR